MRDFINIVVGGILNEDALGSRIPTRLITGKTSSENPLDRNLTVDLNSAKMDRKSFEHNVDLVKNYAALTPQQKSGNHDEVADHFANHVKDNLLYLHDKMPHDQRERARKWYDGANRIAQDRAAEFGLPTATVAAVYAALSPQKTWHENASCGDRVLDTYLNKQNSGWTPNMEKTAQRIWKSEKNLAIYNLIKGRSLKDIDPAELDCVAAWIRTYDESHNTKNYPMVRPEGHLGRLYTNADAYGPGANNPQGLAVLRWGSLGEISKAIAAIRSDGDIDQISALMGERHKVRNFYNNIVDPNGTHGDVTIDTHAVAAGLLHPLGGNTTEVAHNFQNTLPASPEAETDQMDMFAAPKSTEKFVPAKGSARTGIRGTYPLYAEAYRRAAHEREILPREMQSITWEAARNMFNGKGAGKAKFLPQIKALWNSYQKGNLSAQDVREKIHDLSGGIDTPDWAKEDTE